MDRTAIANELLRRKLARESIDDYANYMSSSQHLDFLYPPARHHRLPGPPQSAADMLAPDISILSTLGRPLLFVASRRRSIVPVLNDTLSDSVSHVAQAPVPAKLNEPTVEPFAIRFAERELEPLAYLTVTVYVPDEPTYTA